MTTDEWVAKLNKLGRELDEWHFAVHPTAWQTDPFLIDLKEKYRRLAKVMPVDEPEVKVVQLSFLESNDD